jgi:hypothetical protein
MGRERVRKRKYGKQRNIVLRLRYRKLGKGEEQQSF